MESNKTIRVLQVGMSPYFGGTESFIMNQYRALDKSRVQFDFLNVYDEKIACQDEIEALGGNIYYLNMSRRNGIKAYYKSLDEFFKKYAKDIRYVDFKNIFKLVSGLIIKNQISITGLTAGKKLEDYMRKMCLKKGIANISDIAFPLYISSVDLKNGNTYIFTNSNCKSKDDLILINDIDIGIAVRASCSYPGVFEPVKWNNTELIDGGIRENVPWKVRKNCGADYVMTVTFSSSTKKNCTKNMINVVDCSLSYLQNELYKYEINGSDEVLKIETGDVSLLDSDKVDELYKIGYKAGQMAAKHMAKVY